MPRCKPIERHSLLLPVDLSEQIVHGTVGDKEHKRRNVIAHRELKSLMTVLAARQTAVHASARKAA
jgi:hypothetical protein